MGGRACGPPLCGGHPPQRPLQQPSPPSARELVTIGLGPPAPILCSSSTPPVASHPENPQILQILIQTAQNAPGKNTHHLRHTGLQSLTVCPCSSPCRSPRSSPRSSPCRPPAVPPISTPPVASHPENPQILQILIQTAQNAPGKNTHHLRHTGLQSLTVCPCSSPCRSPRSSPRSSPCRPPAVPPISTPPVASHPENPQILQILIQTAQNAPPPRTLAPRVCKSGMKAPVSLSLTPSGRTIGDNQTAKMPYWENFIILKHRIEWL